MLDVVQALTSLLSQRERMIISQEGIFSRLYPET